MSSIGWKFFTCVSPQYTFRAISVFAMHDNTFPYYSNDSNNGLRNSVGYFALTNHVLSITSYMYSAIAVILQNGELYFLYLLNSLYYLKTLTLLILDQVCYPRYTKIYAEILLHGICFHSDLVNTVPTCYDWHDHHFYWRCFRARHR